GVTAVAGGSYHSLAVRNGSLYAWGANNVGQLGIGSTAWSTVPVAVNGMSSGVTVVAAGWKHSLCVKDGAAWAWGFNSDGQLGNNSTTDSFVPVPVTGLSSGVTAIASGFLRGLAVKAAPFTLGATTSAANLEMGPKRAASFLR